MQIDVAHELVYRSGFSEPVAELKGRTRLIELLLLLGRDADARRPGLTDSDLVQHAAGVLDPKVARRYLQELRRLGLAQRDEGARWSIVLGVGERVSAMPTNVEQALSLVQRTLGGTTRRTRREQLHDRRDANLARAELALARGEPADAIAVLDTLGETGKTVIRGLLPKLPKSVQDEFMTRAVGLRGIACMNRGDTDAALHFLRYAQSRALDWKGGEEWLIRLTATEAAVHRMRAALDGERVDEHVKACVATFERGQRIANETTALPAAQKRELRRWLYAEGTTGLAIKAAREIEQDGTASGTIAQARRWLGHAFNELERLPPDPAAEASTYLMQMRFAVLEGLAGDDRFLVRAAHDISRAASAAEHPLAPKWVQGWVPRYDADFAYFATPDGNDDSVRDSLIDAWTANRGFGFQQLLILARLVAWSIDPVDLLNDEERSRLRGVLKAWHPSVRGGRMEDCPTCANTRDYFRRICCVLKLDGRSGSRDPLALGVWR